MRIILFGASGMIGSRILDEALARGHEVTAIVRHPQKIERTHPALRVVAGDVRHTLRDAATISGHDVVISAVGPGLSGDPRLVVETARSLVDGLPLVGVGRLVVVGGAGSLEVAPGVQLLDAPQFPAAWRPMAEAHREALHVCRAASIDWTYVSPPALIEPGERTGHFRTGGDQLLADEQGVSRISAEDFAAALLDEVEQPRHIRERMTVAY